PHFSSNFDSLYDIWNELQKRATSYKYLLYKYVCYLQNEKRAIDASSLREGYKKYINFCSVIRIKVSEKMMWKDLFIRPNKPEPSEIWTLRRLVIIITILALLALSTLLFMKLHDENPTISTSYSSVDSLLVPNVYLSLDVPFNVSCVTHLNTSCDEHIIQIHGYTSRPYSYKFTNSIKTSQISFSEHSNVYINLLMTALSNPSFTIMVVLYDPEYDGYTVSYDDKNSSEYDKNFVEKMYIDQNPTSQNGTKLQISPGSFIIKEQKEQRSNNILSIVGIIFAHYGGLAAFYVILFDHKNVIRFHEELFNRLINIKKKVLRLFKC
ncbi:20609_t:CDS:2, partial [Dentiscutata erythropus]